MAVRSSSPRWGLETGSPAVSGSVAGNEPGLESDAGVIDSGAE